MKTDKQKVDSSDAMRVISVYLAAKGVPKPKMKEIRSVLCDVAIRDGSDIMFNRIYTAIGLTCVNHLGWGAKRTSEFMHAFDSICDMAGKSDDAAYWSHQMEELYNKTGIIVRCGKDDTFTEFATQEEIDEFNELQEKAQKKGLKSYKAEKSF